jgi:hypothetical protein
MLGPIASLKVDLQSSFSTPHFFQLLQSPELRKVPSRGKSNSSRDANDISVKGCSSVPAVCRIVSEKEDFHRYLNSSPGYKVPRMATFEWSSLQADVGGRSNEDLSSGVADFRGGKHYPRNCVPET